MRFVKNQGYYIEVTNKDIQTLETRVQSSNEKFDFQRRQTLKGVQRYSTPYLDALQEKILSAKDELTKQEYVLLAKAQDKVA
jgi:DNA mismatch repair ATPase MutS